jgi:hypothetical protein
MPADERAVKLTKNKVNPSLFLVYNIVIFQFLGIIIFPHIRSGFSMDQRDSSQLVTSIDMDFVISVV